jgi:hypothetical protein
MPQLDVSGWVPEAVAEQVARLEAVGAQPEVTVTIRWLSAAERGQAARERADEAYCRNLRYAALKGANRSHATKLSR